jgi:proteasome accessory factor B
VIQAKAEPGTQPASARGREVSQLLDATLNHRRVTMRYHSFSSNREKQYIVEPYRVVFAQGALYVVAYVPEYKEQRTFAVDRIRSLSVSEEKFEPVELEEDAFAHSLGVHQGPPERIEIRFDPQIARYVKERVWHASQEIHDQPDGSVRLELHVSNDASLRSWILGFGALARVLSPESLVRQIVAEIEKTKQEYGSRARDKSRRPTRNA